MIIGDIIGGTAFMIIGDIKGGTAFVHLFVTETQVYIHVITIDHLLFMKSWSFLSMYYAIILLQTDLCQFAYITDGCI